MKLISDQDAETIAKMHGFEWKDDGDLWKGDICISLDAWKNQESTPAEFKAAYNYAFHSQDLLWDLERILQGLLDRDGEIAVDYGTEPEINEDGGDGYFINVEDSAYWYMSIGERNADLKLMELIINEFRIINELSNRNLVIQP